MMDTERRQDVIERARGLGYLTVKIAAKRMYEQGMTMREIGARLEIGKDVVHRLLSATGDVAMRKAAPRRVEREPVVVTPKPWDCGHCPYLTQCSAAVQRRGPVACEVEQ